MAEDIWDLIVVGAGPAGSSAALAAVRTRPDARVLLLDRADFPRDKSCGDGIAPHALDVLTGLGASEVSRGYAPVASLHLGYRSGGAVHGDMARPAHVIPRRVFDARLVTAARQAGAEWARHRVRTVRQHDEYVYVDETWRARVVVAADGAESAVRRGLGLARNGDGHLAMAIRGYAPVRTDLATQQRIVFADRDWPAYAWSFPIGDGRANVGYGEVLRAGRSPTRVQLMERLDALIPGSGDGATDWRGHHLPLSSQRPRPDHGRVLLVGDALSLINPMTGEGIYYAVLSGMLAGRAAVVAGPTRPGPGPRYRAELRRELGTHLRHTTVATRLAREPRIVKAGLRAADRNPMVFDALVELGLGRGLLTARTVGAVALGLSG